MYKSTLNEEVDILFHEATFGFLTVHINNKNEAQVDFHGMTNSNDSNSDLEVIYSTVVYNNNINNSNVHSEL